MLQRRMISSLEDVGSFHSISESPAVSQIILKLILDLDDLVALPNASQTKVVIFRYSEILDVVEDPIVAVFMIMLLVSFNELLLLLFLAMNDLLFIS
jgi:hypothetical protein